MPGTALTDEEVGELSRELGIPEDAVRRMAAKFYRAPDGAEGPPEAKAPPRIGRAKLLEYLGTDAERWAQEFAVALDVSDEAPDGTGPLGAEAGGLVHGWFANAIGAGESAGYSRAMRELEERARLEPELPADVAGSPPADVAGSPLPADSAGSDLLARLTDAAERQAEALEALAACVDARADGGGVLDVANHGRR